MNWTLTVAFLGLVSGSTGTTLGVLNWRRSAWNSRGTHSDLVREVIGEMKDAIAKLERDPAKSPRSVNSNALQSRRQQLASLETRVSDRRLKNLIRSAERNFAAAVSYDDIADHDRRVSTMKSARESLKQVIARLDKIDRKS